MQALAPACFFKQTGKMGKFLEIFVVLFALFLVAVVIELLTITPSNNPDYGVVVEKTYIPSQTSTGVGPIVGSGGSGGYGGGVAVVTSTTSEERSILIKSLDGKPVRAEAKTIEDYIEIAEGDTVKYNLYSGIFGLIHEYKVEL